MKLLERPTKGDAAFKQRVEQSHQVVRDEGRRHTLSVPVLPHVLVEHLHDSQRVSTLTNKTPPGSEIIRLNQSYAKPSRDVNFVAAFERV